MIEIDFVLPFSLLRNQRVDRQFLFSAGGLDVGKKCIQPIELIQAEKLRTAATDRRARSRSGTTAFIQLGIKQAKFEFSGHDRFESAPRSEEHTSELQSRFDLVCRLLLEKKNR